MKTNSMKRIVPFVLVLFIFQSCCPFWVKDQKKCEKEYELRDEMDIKKYTNMLRETLEKVSPAKILDRRLASRHLHAMRRVLEGKIESDLEKEIDSLWSSHKVSEETKKLLLERINIFAKMPSYLQLKLVDNSFLTSGYDQIYPYGPTELSAENAGIVCGDPNIEVCQTTTPLGKLEIHEPSQALTLESSRPIAAVANGNTGLLIINISSPNNPSYFNSPMIPYRSTSTEFVNDVELFSNSAKYYAIISSNHTIQNSGCVEIVEITSPITPVQRSKIDGSYSSIAITEDHAWGFSFNNQGNTIDIINLSDISNPFVANSISETGKIVELAFKNNYLHVSKDDGNVTVYQFSIDASSLPNLVWTWAGNLSPCSTPTLDDKMQIIAEDYRSIVVRDGGLNVLTLSSSWPVESGIILCDNYRHNSGNITINGDLIIDAIMDNRTQDCEKWPELHFYHVPEFGPSSPSLFTKMGIPNEVNGLVSRGDKIYTADYSLSNCNKIQTDSLHFRIYSLPIAYEYYANIKPTIETVNGQLVKEEDLPNMSCGSGQTIFCTSDAQCGETGICIGGICAQLPIYEVSNESDFVLTGTNYWDINAQVLIQNIPQTSWIPYNASVYGDEYCDLADQMSITLNNAVLTSGKKKIKIRNYNTDPKKHICVNCDDMSDLTCTPDFVESEEVTVYFRNSSTDPEPGFDLRVIQVRAIHGSGGCGDLDGGGIFRLPPCPGGDDEIIMLSNAPFGGFTMVTPDEDGWEFSSDNRIRQASTVLSSVDPNGPDPTEIPSAQLYELNSNVILGSVLASFGIGCLTSSAVAGICGPYSPGCIVACASIAVVGIVLVATSGRDFLTSESWDGLYLTKSLAQQILTFGDQCLPPSWRSNETTESINTLVSVSNLITTGGGRSRILTKRYESLPPTDAIYEIQFLLSER